MGKGLRLLLAVFLILSVISCAVNPVTGKRELMFVSESQEIEIGKEAAPSLYWSYGGEFKDPQLHDYLEGVVRKIWKISERPYLPMRFVVQNTSVPNAFALPGYVAITRGLLAELQNEAQFVAVMGHEVGHVMARHTAKRITLGEIQQLGLVLGGVLLSGTSHSDTFLRLGAIGSNLLLLKYDRSQEIQADRLGVKYMAKLGYDPYQAIEAHKRLQVAVNNYLKRRGIKRKGDSFIEQILSTHPRHEVRIQEIKDMINHLPKYTIKGDGKFKKRFLKMTRRLRRINKVYFKYDKAVALYNKNELSQAENLIKKAIRKQPDQAAFYNLYGMIEYKKDELTRAKKLFKKALRIEKDYQPAIYGLGLIKLKERHYEAALKKFRKSLQLYPSHPGSYFGMGKTLYKLKRYRSAINYLKPYAQYNPKHREVHGLLGICYEKTGHLRAAVREYELQVRVAPDTELGQYAQLRLLVLKSLLRVR